MSIKAAHLNMLKHIRLSKGVTRVTLSNITGIDLDYLTALDKCKAEPYLDEACVIARTLCIDGLMPLITPDMDHPYLLDRGVPLPSDVDMLRAGVPLPLSLAVRITERLGLRDPMQLQRTDLTHELWMMMVTERSPACPFCMADVVGGAAHLRGCLPDRLWGMRGREYVSITARPIAERAHKGRQSSDFAKNLRAMRDDRGMSAQAVSDASGVPTSYLSKLETLRLPLTLAKAHVLADVLGCDVALLYAPVGTVGALT
jgi:hypothetical protein